MRHRKNFNHLGRKSGHRKAMLSNMASSLIMHKRIQTTTAKAKALRSFVEPLLTKSKDDSTHSRRIVFSKLQDKEAVTELFRDVSPKIIDRPGGYTRILKTGTRLGDNADMCVIELVDYNENLLAAQEEKGGKSKRRRRGSSKKKEDSPKAVAAPQTDLEKKTPAVEETKEITSEEAAPEAAKAEETVNTNEVIAEDTAVAEEAAEIKAEDKDVSEKNDDQSEETPEEEPKKE
ncbi:MAG: 50S ribosomal protein L17 [Bacteroidales bacterium]|nr:50S ribosomal protein L17 [Bacteroidales bacterium]